MQPVVLVSDDGRSAAGRFRLFQPRTGKTVGKAGDFFGASFWGGMYHDRYVLEDGVWRIWELTLDEPYITPVAWKDGVWAKSKDPLPPPPGAPVRAFRRRQLADADIPLTALGKREEHFRGGTGEPTQWPTILPMWFDYTNPVSGRVPELFQDNCVPCALRPDLGSNANGYQEPPDAPAGEQVALTRCDRHCRRSQDGFDSQARSRSSGQQLTILSAGIPARRAWASAVSAYESWLVVCASLSRAKRQPASSARAARL